MVVCRTYVRDKGWVIATVSVEESLLTKLRQNGLTQRAIDAVWPGWWSAEAEGSLSATTELRYTLARRLGISPQSLFAESPEFTWRDDARFKNLGDLNTHEASVLASFCVGVGRQILFAVPADSSPRLPEAHRLRDLILGTAESVNLLSLLTYCWLLGIPVVQLMLFPLSNKGMHAVATRSGERYSVLIGRESRFRSQVCFWLAHELGHISLGQVGEACALLDMEDPIHHDGDEEERAADAYALELLTGSDSPTIEITSERYTATQLANAVLDAGPPLRVDPAVLALCAGHQSRMWKESFGALKALGDEDDVAARINELAVTQLRMDELSPDNRRFLQTVLGDNRW
jgi:hypothetical protein